jgi:hypothetical protein
LPLSLSLPLAVSLIASVCAICLLWTQYDRALGVLTLFVDGASVAQSTYTSRDLSIQPTNFRFVRAFSLGFCSGFDVFQLG